MAEVKTFRANFDFSAKEEDELDLLSGDIIDVAQVHEGRLGTAAIVTRAWSPIAYSGHSNWAW